MSQKALYLGLDLGTSGVRSSVIDAAGTEVSQAQIRYARPSEPVASAEEWWQATQACLDQQIASLRHAGCNPRDIRAMAVDGTSGSMVLIDEGLKPVTPALMYHSSGFDEEAHIIARFAEPGSITLGRNSALARLLRLQSHDRDQRARFLCHQADFIVAQLCAQAGFSDDNNALKTGFDPAQQRWPSWLAKAGVRTELLPHVLRVGAPVGAVAPAIQARFGFAPELVVRAGTTDSIAAFLASGATEMGDAVTSLGTTLAIKLLSSHRIDDQSRGLYSHYLHGQWLVGGASNSGGGVLLDYFTSAQLETLSLQIDAETDTGLDYYPLSRPGERFPTNDPDLQPRLTPRSAQDALFLQGLLEGIARIEAAGYQALIELGAPLPKRIYTSGGGGRNPAWTHIRRRIVGPHITDARSSDAAYGMALLCLLQQ
jgi:D-ribulokinase